MSNFLLATNVRASTAKAIGRFLSKKLKLQRTRNFGPLVGSKALVSDEASAPGIRKSRWGFQEPLGGVGVSSLKFHGFIDESSSFGAEIL
mgnify:CR=1 FL=1